MGGQQGTLGIPHLGLGAAGIYVRGDIDGWGRRTQVAVILEV